MILNEKLVADYRAARIRSRKADSIYRAALDEKEIALLEVQRLYTMIGNEIVRLVDHPEEV